MKVPMKRQDLKPSRSLQCDYCWRSFYENARGNFHKHIMLCHTDRKSSGFLEFERSYIMKRRSYIMKRQDLKSTRSLQCDYCWRDFPACAKTGNRPINHFYEHVMRYHTDRKSSGYLEFERLNKDERKKQRMRRTKKMKRNCDHCNYGSVSKGQFFAHIIRAHSTAVNVEWYLCEDCDKRCNQKDYLQRHIQQHLLTDLLRCDTCADDGKSSYCRRGFFIHFLTHLRQVPDEMKYVCDVCDFATARKRQDLWEHVFGAHMQRIDAAQFYVCNECGSRQLNKNALRKHIIDIHLGTTLRCEICSHWSTCWKSALAKHTQRHWTSGLKLKFECTDCNLQFNCNDTAIYHRKKEHNQGALLVCDDCQTGKRWLNKGPLGSHQRRVHFIHV